MPDRFLRTTAEAEYSVPLEEMWEMLGNTDRLNREIGLPPFRFGDPAIDAENFHRPASARIYGLTFHWREYPFAWVRNQRYGVLRVFEKGPLQQVWSGVELFPAESGCRVRVFAEITPRQGWGWLSPLMRLGGRQNVNRVLACCGRYAALREVPRTEAPLHRPRARAPRVERGQMNRLLERLAADFPAGQQVTERLGALIQSGGDEEVLHMRPYVLAERWGLPRDRVLAGFLHATVTGLLELDWELMCPNCRVPKAGFRSLPELTGRFHCDLCGVDYETDLDRVTELRFSVHPSLRKAEDAAYCIGGPFNTPHILAQHTLLPGVSHTLELALDDEPLRCRVLRRNHTTALTPHAGGLGEARLVYADEGWLADGLRFQPGAVRLHWHNNSPSVQVAVVEKENWDELAATAARVMAMREFRTLFSSEVLSPGQEIGIRNLCLLFTDLKSSTELYEKVGDAPAFGHVRRHFEFLIPCFESHQGGIIKTIGDAVMASFPSPTAALRAALEVQRSVGELNAGLALEEEIIIKIGLHHGPAIAVNANGQMDYFGRTVNIAARIQGLSDGGDVVFAHDLLKNPDFALEFQQARCRMEEFSAPLKGIAGPMQLCRLWPGAPAPSDAASPRPAARRRLFRP